MLCASAVKLTTRPTELMEGKPIIGGTVSSPDPNIYCAMANAATTSVIEMQHSRLRIRTSPNDLACRGSRRAYIRSRMQGSEIQETAHRRWESSFDSRHRGKAQAVKWSVSAGGRRSRGAPVRGAVGQQLSAVHQREYVVVGD
jgi:hypothetical protein